MACPVCGFDPSSLTPPDAIVALRSFPRRYRELLLGEDDEPRPEVLVEAGRAAAAIASITDDLERVLVTDDAPVRSAPSVATDALDPGDPSTALDRLTAVTTRAAALASSQPPDAWTRKGVRSSGPVTAGELLREAVHAGVHHLRLVPEG